MKISRRTLHQIALSITAAWSMLAGFAATDARAFTLHALSPSGTALGWNGDTVTFDVNYSNCPISDTALNTAIDAAIDIWNTVPSTYLTVQRGASVTTSAATALAQSSAGNPVIICDTSFSTDLGGADADVIPGVATNLHINSSTLRIDYDVLMLNAESGKNANIANVSSTLLTVIMAHEIGHILGLGHSADPNALMYYDASAKTTLGLAQDDFDGITYLYPRKEPSAGKFFGCATIAALPPSDGRGRRTSGVNDDGSELGLLTQFAGLLAFCGWVVVRAKRGATLH